MATPAGRGAFAEAQERYDDAVRRLDETHTVYRELGHRVGEANALYEFGRVLLADGEPMSATERLYEAERIYRQIGVESPWVEDALRQAHDALRQLDDAQ